MARIITQIITKKRNTCSLKLIWETILFYRIVTCTTLFKFLIPVTKRLFHNHSIFFSAKTEIPDISREII